jgi:hypothetical protein
MKKTILLSSLILLVSALTAYAQDNDEKAGNPVLDGWYADPEGAVFGDQYWIFPTYSAPYDEQVFMDSFSSPDLVNWKKHERIIDTAAVAWADSAIHHQKRW